MQFSTNMRIVLGDLISWRNGLISISSISVTEIMQIAEENVVSYYINQRNIYPLDKFRKTPLCYTETLLVILITCFKSK